MANLLAESVILEKVSDSNNTSTFNPDMSKKNSLKEPSTPEKLPLQHKLPNIPNNLEKSNLRIPRSPEITLTDKNYIAKLKKDESCLSVSLNHSDKDKNVSEDFDIAVALPHKPLQGVIAFVDVRAEHENRSKAVSRELEKLGATISEKFTKNVTHVVFKDGKPTTFSQVRKCLSVYFVSVLWVDSCKSTMSWVNEALFPAKVPQYMESPCPLARVKRIKSLQPKSFEDEFSNSARKDERRRRRFNKINKDVDITPDHIICLDSQEYIKSSDLYKLVATPRPVPDTPWMLNYINGSSFSNIDPELEQEDIQCKLNFENEEINMSHNANEKNMLENADEKNMVHDSDGKNMVHDSDGKSMVHDSEDKKKKNLKKPNLEIDFFGRRFSQRLSCLKNLNASPSEESCSSPSKKLCNKLEKMFNSGSEKPYSSIKPDVISTNTIVDLGISATQVCSFESFHTALYSKNVSKEQFSTQLVSDDLVSSEKKSIDSQNYCSRLQNDTCSNLTNGNFPNKIITTEYSETESKEASDLNDISMDTSKFVHESVNCVKKPLNCMENSANKRKKLLSRAKLTPQDELINPRIKKKKLKYFEEKPNDSGHGNDSGHVFMENPNVKFDTYKALQNLEERKKSGNSCSSSLSICHVGGSLAIGQCFEKPFSTSYLECHLSQLSVDSTITAKHCAKPSSTSKTSKCHTVSCNINESLDMKDRLQKNDFLLSRSSERLKSLQRRSSGVDFEISKKFRKTLKTSTVSANIQTVKGIGSADKPISVTDHNMESKNVVSNFSKEMNNNKKLSSDEDFSSDHLDSSFVHDENAGLIVPLKQKQESIRFHNLPELTHDNDSGISDGEVGSDILLHSVQSSTQSNLSLKLKASLVATSLHLSEHDFFKAAAKHLGGFQLRTNVVADTTHVVSGSGRRTLNVLRAIVKGCWLLSPKWVSDSYDKGKWLPEDAYELTEDYPVAQISRTQRILEGRSRHAVLFSSFFPIYLAETTFPSHEEMEKLILECGGRLTTSLRKAGIGIGHIRCRRQDFCAVSEKWLLDSISNGQVMPTRSYEIQTLNRDESPDF